MTVAPKSGKSFLALDVAVAVASGAPCLRRFRPARTGHVLLFAAEDALHVVRACLAHCPSRRPAAIRLRLGGTPTLTLGTNSCTDYIYFSTTGRDTVNRTGREHGRAELASAPHCRVCSGRAGDRLLAVVTLDNSRHVGAPVGERADVAICSGVGPRLVTLVPGSLGAAGLSRTESDSAKQRTWMADALPAVREAACGANRRRTSSAGNRNGNASAQKRSKLGAG